MELSSTLCETLQRSVEASPEQLRRLVAELAGLLVESEEEFVRRRYAELQQQTRGAALWCQLANEVEGHLFRGKSYSERQLRRMVYGS